MESLVNPSPAFWAGRNVFVTGHTGFKGAWLVLWLKRLGATVTGYSLAPSTDPNLFDLTQGAGIDRDVRGDVRDYDALAQCIESCRPEIVFHLAAQSLVRVAYRDPIGTFATNVMGTVHLFEAIRRAAGVRAVLNVTSDKCYENRGLHRPYREDDPLGGNDPYSASKACAELATAAWRRAFFESGGSTALLASVRAGNVVGGGDWADDRLVPDCIRAMRDGRTLDVRYPDAVRPWQYVLEPLCGYLLLAERLCGKDPAAAQAWNFGPLEEDGWPVSLVVDTVARLWGSSGGWRVDTLPKPPEAAFLKLDSAKARAHLGWHPRLRLNDTLAWTVDWYRRQALGENATVLCMEQIDRYERKTTP